MSDNSLPFKPFDPAVPVTPLAPIDEKTEPPTKKPAKPRTAKPATSRKKKTGQPRAKRKAPELQQQSPKFDLQTALAASQLLAEDDFSLFEKLVVDLDAETDAARKRILSALTRIFA